MTSKWEKKSRTERRRLSRRHEKLLDFYFGEANFNKSKALALAGYRCPHDYLRLFDHPAIVEETKRRERAAREKFEVTHDRLVEELRRIAFANIYDYGRVDKDGNIFLDFSNVPAEVMAAIGTVTVETYMEGKGDEAREVKRVKVTPYNKLQAIDQLMRHTGLSKDKTSGAIADLAERLNAGLGRLGKLKEEGEDEKG